MHGFQILLPSSVNKMTSICDFESKYEPDLGSYEPGFELSRTNQTAVKLYLRQD